jgi:hypothetical protein
MGSATDSVVVRKSNLLCTMFIVWVRTWHRHHGTQRIWAPVRVASMCFGVEFSPEFWPVGCLLRIEVGGGGC